MSSAALVKQKKSEALVWSGLGFLFAVSVGLSLSTGSVSLPLWKAFLDLFSGRVSEYSIVLWDIRIPRTLLGILVGSSLGLAGAAMQGLLRNPLAEPGVMGVSGGAALGAVISLYTGFSASFSMALPLGGMMGAFASVLLIYFFAGKSMSLQTLILAGVAVNTLAFAGTSIALNLSHDPYAALEIVFWQMGSIADRSWEHIRLAAPLILAGSLLLLADRQALTALTLGEETAASLGVSLRQVRLRMILGTALSVGAGVSVSGNIGFIGLVVPHLLRRFVGNDPGKLLGVSALGGAVLMLWADIAVRLIPTSSELKLGVLTSLVGAPFFLALIFKLRREWV